MISIQLPGSSDLRTENKTPPDESWLGAVNPQLHIRIDELQVTLYRIAPDPVTLEKAEALPMPTSALRRTAEPGHSGLFLFLPPGLSSTPRIYEEP